MKITSRFIKSLHLDQKYGLLTARQVNSLMWYFSSLDFRDVGWIDDAQFRMFMRASTDLNDRNIDDIFELLDLDGSSSCEFDEFYLLVAIMIAIKDHQEKQFMSWHWRTCFELLDVDKSKTVSIDEFKTLGSLLGFGQRSIRRIFEEFDVSGDRELDIQEFRMFTLACIDEQAKFESRKTKKKMTSLISKKIGRKREGNEDDSNADNCSDAKVNERSASVRSSSSLASIRSANTRSQARALRRKSVQKRGTVVPVTGTLKTTIE